MNAAPIAAKQGPRALVRHLGPLNGTVRLPGSKSLSNRYLFCAALAGGQSTIENIAVCDDTDRMLNGVRALGIDAVLDRSRACATIAGCNGVIPVDEAVIDAGAAGTAMRFLTALATLGQGDFRLDGTSRMRERPIAALVEGLRALGATIDYAGQDGFPPLDVHAHGLSGGEIEFDSPESSQYVSAVLMAAPRAESEVFVRVSGRGLVSRPYVEMTLQVMRELGVECLDADAARFIVETPQSYRAGDYAVEPDASAAAYFWAIAAITSGCVRVVGLSSASVQGDAAFVDVLAAMGCKVAYGDNYIEVTGPSRGELRGVSVDLNAMPDTVQTLAVVALAADGPTRIENVANLRVKETDRLSALARELSKLGAAVELREDGLTITPPARIVRAEIDTYDDHRMAMSFALAGLLGEEVLIRDADCVSKSFPDYFDVLNTLAG